MRGNPTFGVRRCETRGRRRVACQNAIPYLPRAQSLVSQPLDFHAQRWIQPASLRNVLPASGGMEKGRAMIPDGCPQKVPVLFRPELHTAALTARDAGLEAGLWIASIATATVCLGKMPLSDSGPRHWTPHSFTFTIRIQSSDGVKTVHLLNSYHNSSVHNSPVHNSSQNSLTSSCPIIRPTSKRTGPLPLPAAAHVHDSWWWYRGARSAA